MPRSPIKPVTLTFDLRSRKSCIYLDLKACITSKDDYDIRMYWRDIALATCSRREPVLNMNIEGNYQVTLWRHWWRHHHDKYFCIIWDDLLIAEGKLKLCLIFQNFQNSRHFEVTTNFFTGSNTGSLILQRYSYEYFQYFELLIDSLAEILIEI